MIFNTLDFIIFFLVIISLITILKNRKYQHILLLLGSYFFFYYSNNYLIFLLILSTLLDFYIGKKIWNTSNLQQKKIFLVISLAGNLGLLGFFKYADFAILQFNLLGNIFNISNEIPFLNIALPVGISFYTFQTISYTVDIYRGKLKPSNSLREFALFVAFFPQLVAGPIVRASEFLPQLQEKIKINGNQFKKNVLQNSNLRLGITIVLFGFLKKMFFADNIAPLVDNIFSNPIGMDSFTIILGAIAFGIQIYGDFSGYSDIAIGSALILGFKLPVNFNKPYFATSPADFWRRWHISLSSWLRDYLYIPLGGSKKSHLRTYVNLGIVMFLGGLWHGASWNFVVWGLLHGMYLAIHRLTLNKFPILAQIHFFKTRTGKIISIFMTQYLVFLAWIAFRVKDTDSMLYSMEKYIFLDFKITETFELISVNKFSLIIMGLFMILHIISYRKPELFLTISKLKLRYWTLILITILLCLLFFYDGDPNDFIYFRF